MNAAVRLLAASLALAAAGCTGLAPSPSDADRLYLLEARPRIEAPATPADRVLAVADPRARPGFDTAQMAYVERAHALEYYAKNRWADTPARMLGPLLEQTLAQSGVFEAVVRSPAAAEADLQLDTEIVKLQQEFDGDASRIRFTIRVRLVDTKNRDPIAAATFEEVEPAPSADPYGGVLAANAALERLLGRVVAFCARHAG